MNLSRLFVLALVGLVACAGSARGTQHAGDVSERPSLDVLPHLDVKERKLTREMRKARARAEDSLSFGLPAAFHEEGSKATWTEKELLEWLREKHRRVEEAHVALELAGAQNPRQGVLSASIDGLVFEEAARTLMEVPHPVDLPFGLHGISIFRDVMQENADVCLKQAEEAYAACVERAKKFASLASYGPFCEGRAAALPRPGSALPGALETAPAPQVPGVPEAAPAPQER